ncbi:hypothetical protein HMPREF9458_03278, partial [Eggerthella lenta 1_1_60AFAA]
QLCPGSANSTIGPTSGRCQSSARTRSRRHIRLKSWVGPSISSPLTVRSPAKRSLSCGGRSSKASPSSKRRRRPLPLSRTSSRSMPGKAENGASLSIFGDRQAPVPVFFARRGAVAAGFAAHAHDLAGPAELVAPAFAAVLVGGDAPGGTVGHGGGWLNGGASLVGLEGWPKRAGAHWRPGGAVGRGWLGLAGGLERKALRGCAR